MMQGCKWFELSTNDTIKLLIESPLDSMTIYHKIENLSRANLYLAHSPLELDDDDLEFPKMDNLS